MCLSWRLFFSGREIEYVKTTIDAALFTFLFNGHIYIYIHILIAYIYNGISCIEKPRIVSGNRLIRLIFFLFGNKIASLFDQKFRTKYLLFRKSRRAFSIIPIPKSIYLIIIMHACVYKMVTSIKFWYTRMRIHIEKKCYGIRRFISNNGVRRAKNVTIRE